LIFCKTKVGYDEIESVSEGSIKALHYIVPVIDSEITRAGHIMNFVENDDHTGYYDLYPELKFVYGHSMNVSVNASITR